MAEPLPKLLYGFDPGTVNHCLNIPPKPASGCSSANRASSLRTDDCQQHLRHGHGQDRAVCPLRTFTEQREAHRLDGVKLIDRTDDVSCNCSQHPIPPAVGAAYHILLLMIAVYNQSLRWETNRGRKRKIQGRGWIPACAGMTLWSAGMTPDMGSAGNYALEW